VRQRTARAVALYDRLKLEHPRLQIHLSSDRQEEAGIIRSADVIVAATSSEQPLFDSSYVRAGTRVILVGSYKPHMREVDDQLVKRSRIVVDSKKACLQEAGELISAGITERDLEELGDMSTGKPNEDIIIFKSVRLAIGTADHQVGLGVQDVAIAKLVLDEAVKMGRGTRIAAFD
jgi:ornithine cyclodeaminase/alanine dehydrogenase-like protein (mu-crystallin family)